MIRKIKINTNFYFHLIYFPFLTALVNLDYQIILLAD